jgi:NRAMP (natural resistance-associated macrophage protein)-like metal ion transporter
VGPGWIVTAAFIGPGTVTTATVAGVDFGFALLWALTFSTLATIALQEMSARLGLVTGQGLGEAIRRRFDRAPRAVAVALVIAAIAIGNAAYETGNLLGAALGIDAVFGGGVRLWALVIAAATWALLWTGSYRILERALVAMVAVMCLTFLATAVAVRPDAIELLRGSLVPRLPDGATLVALGLVGTTVVPYNLFLHAAAVREKWAGEEDLPAARLDLAISIALGGIVSMAIVVTAAGTIGAEASASTGRATGAGIASAADMARQLEPTLGAWAGAFFAVGLFAAGMTSAITAPLAAAWATAGALGWERELRSGRVRAVWLGVLLAGAAFATSEIRPVPAILFAQVANGILLPAIAAFLLVAVNDRRSMGRWANGAIANLAGLVVLAVALLLGLRGILAALGVLGP